MKYSDTRSSAILTTTALASVLLMAGWVSGVRAQDALGGGDALDANLSTAGTRNIGSPDETLAYRVRNLLVTGNVAGGRGFRDSVGYTAADDFRGSLGSDDLFEFRADSAFSAPSYILYRDQLTDLQIGQDLGTLAFRRDFTGSTYEDVVHPMQDMNLDLRNAELRLDRLISDASLSELIERTSEARPIGVGMDGEGRMVVPTTTSVLGLETVLLDEARKTAGMTVLDRARVYQESQESQDGTQTQTGAGTSEPRPKYANSFAQLLAMDTRVTGQSAENRIEADRQGHDDLLKKVAERLSDGEALDEETAAQLDEDFLDLRRYLQGLGVQEDDEQPMTDDDAAQPDDADVLADIKLPGEESDDQQPSEDPGAQPPQPSAAEVFPTLESVGIALRHGQQIQSYASGDEDRFNELVRSAEESIATGEYFWAERRFTRALRFSPNHPLVLAGKAHAQLGAGLYVPASLSIRQVLIRYPELIDVEYSRGILPARVRLLKNTEDIRERIDQGVEPALMGFLLAYIGHQIDDRPMIERGLETMAETAPDDRLLPLLRTVWLDVPEDDNPDN